MNETIVKETMTEDQDPTAIRAITVSSWGNATVQLGDLSWHNVDLEQARDLIERAKGEGILAAEDGYRYDFAANDYGERYLPELVEKARNREFGPPLRQAGKVRVKRYTYHTIWVEE